MPAALTADHHPACYPGDPAAALAFFRDGYALAAKLDLPPAPPQGKLAGIVAPHIDFRVSLRAYAAAFAPLLHEPLAETYLILGVGHRSRLEWNLDRRDYTTPLGRAKCAVDWVNVLAGSAGDPARLSEPKAHHGEHSIEFPLLWLQALHRLHPDGGKKLVRFLPLLCGGLHAYVEKFAEWDELGDFHRLAHALGGLFRENPPGEKLRVIVSIDGCHLGPRFHHPFRVDEKMLHDTAAWEEKLWAAAAGGDAREFLDWIRAEGNERYFDGIGALALLFAASEKKHFAIQRTFYEQWFTPRDASAVTFSSGRILTQ
jgi:AmmeMemoRadiSam system protein B